MTTSHWITTTALLIGTALGGSALLRVEAHRDRDPVAAGVRRTADGRPDLSGIWQALSPVSWNIEGHQARPGVPASLGIVEGHEIPYQPWALTKRDEQRAQRAGRDPEADCNLLGVPRIMYHPLPFQIVQAPEQITILFEYAHAVRHIRTNGTAHPDGPIEWWLGDSRGRWEGDTLVVSVKHFTDKTWLDRTGNFHSEALEVEERYTPLGPDHITYVATLTDPKVFTRPWRLRTTLYRHVEPQAQLLEYECYGFTHERYYP